MVALLFMLVLAATVLAWAMRRDERRERFARLVPGWLLAAAACRVLLEAVEAGAARAMTPVLAALAAAAGLLAWAQLAQLAAVRPRFRDRFLRAPLAAIAVVVALAHGPFGALVTLTVLAALAFRWREALSTRQLFATACGLVAFVALGAPGWATPQAALEPAAGSAAHALLSFARWSDRVSWVLALLAVLPVVGRFVHDPTLGIRTVRWRVALSHTLVVLVPLAITGTLWVLTTFLGAGADRALVASRAIEAEAARLRTGLAQALATPGPPGAALAALAHSRRGEWPGARAWLLEGGSFGRVAGDSVAGEAFLPAWAARLDSLRGSGVVQLRGRRWLGAAVRDSATARAAIALVPVGEALAGEPAKVVGARLWMAETAEDDLAAATDSLPVRLLSAADSAELRRARELTRRLGLPDTVVQVGAPEPRRGRMRLTTGGDTLDVNEGGETTGTGRAVVLGVRHGARGWRDDDFGLRVQVDFREAVTGLYRNVGVNPYNFLPLLTIYGLLALLLPVAIFNQRVVRQLGRSVTEPVAGLRRATAALADGRLDHRIEVKGDDELWDTARAFNEMAGGLEVAREREKEREKLENELELARRIQARLLPAGPPTASGLEISGHSESAREVGGDYFDHLVLPDGRVLLVIADVSGKGVPAALLMSAFRASLMSQDASRGDPAEVASHLNEFLHRSVDPGKFVTAFVGFLDGRDGRFVYANAGHNPPVLLRRDGRVEWLTTGGLILGILSPSPFESGQVVVEPGDLLALYTDGVTEGADASGELFGEDRLVDLLRRRAGEPCTELAEHLVREVRAFEGEQGPADDITVLLARRSRG